MLVVQLVVGPMNHWKKKDYVRSGDVGKPVDGVWVRTRTTVHLKKWQTPEFSLENYAKHCTGVNLDESGTLL